MLTQKELSSLTGEWRKLQNQVLHHLYSSVNINGLGFELKMFSRVLAQPLR